MWDAQIEYLSRDFRILRYDTRGHGQSHVLPAPYTLPDLGQDLLDLMDELEIEQAAFCGLSLGGLTGIWLGVHAPDRFSKIILCNTAPRIANTDVWSKRIDLISAGGLGPIAESSAERWFTPAFCSINPEIISWTKAQVLSTSTEGYKACCAALGSADLWSDVFRIKTPSLIVAADQDKVTTVEEGMRLALAIRGARLEILSASHLSNVENPQAFNRVLNSFLKS
jgi:3-oxoadipate enol-lactonase